VQARDARALGLDDDVAELLDVAQTAERVDRELEVLRPPARAAGRAAGRYLRVLLADGVRNSDVVRLRAWSFCGSSQTRMLYWPAPNTLTSPTPGCA
jgi:hypothetical protein